MCLATHKTFGAQSIIDQKSKIRIDIAKTPYKNEIQKKIQLLKQCFYPAVEV